jgi:superfamily II DNA or RNA helicase
MKKREAPQKLQEQIAFVSALDLLLGRQYAEPASNVICHRHINGKLVQENSFHAYDRAAIRDLRFPFVLKPDQNKAVEAWLANKCRGSIIYGSGTGKTEIAFECARRVAEANMQGDRNRQCFNIVLLVPRIVLVEQNYGRLVRYRVPAERTGKYFGEEKQIREITICTYHSALANLEVVRRADMIIFDEVHLARGAFGKIFSAASEGKQKALLGLTATIDENDPKVASIISILPPVRKYLIKDAVRDKRLAKPIVFSIKVTLTDAEQSLYDQYSAKIRNISKRLGRYDARDMMALMKTQGFPRWQARAWLINVKKRKRLLASSDNKIQAALDLIVAKHPDEKVMVFSETLESIRKLRQLLTSKGVRSALIDSSTPSPRRQKILSEWGKRFFVLLSVHTLEIGYDVPEARVEIILATTSNRNQIVQRIGRVLRKAEGKDSAYVYLIYVSDTRDGRILASVKEAIETSGGDKNED